MICEFDHLCLCLFSIIIRSVSESKNKIASRKIRPAEVLIFLVAAIGLYILLPEIKLFHSSITILLTANLNNVIIGSIFVVLTFFFSAATYFFLAGSKFNFYRGLLIEFSGMFTNRLLPAGIGGIGINYLYLRKQKYTVNKATAIIAVNNMVGLIGHLTLFTVAILFFKNNLPKLNFRYSYREQVLYITLSLIILICGIFIYKRYRSHVWPAIHSFFGLLGEYRHKPVQFGCAFLNSMCLTLCNIVALYFCSRSMGLHVPFVALFLVFTLGIIFGTASPTPGGLGATEAGLVVGLIAFHVQPNEALALALIYRLISFWVPLILGGGIFFVIKKLDYV